MTTPDLMFSLDWRPVPGWPSYGATLDGQIIRLFTQSGRFKGKALRQYENDATDKHLYVRLCENCKPRKRHVHHLIAETWIGQRPAGLEIDHKNQNPQDNRASNLEYVTPEENKRRYIASGKHAQDVARYLASERYREISRLQDLNGRNTPRSEWKIS